MVMEFNINVKIKGGPRTSVEIHAEPTGVNLKTNKIQKWQNNYRHSDF